MNVDFGIWSKLTRLVVFLLFLAGVLMVAVWYLPLINNNQRIREGNLQIEDEIRKEEDKAKELKASIESLARDPKAVERLARAKMGFAKTGEIVTRFEMPVTNAPANR